MSEPLLSVENLSIGYDAVDILHDVSLSALEQQITCLLGANGAGKTTLIRSIFGSVRARRGHIRFCGEDITRLETHQIIQRGLIAVPESNRVFLKLSVRKSACRRVPRDFKSQDFRQTGARLRTVSATV